MRTDTGKKKNPGWQAGANYRKTANGADILLARLQKVKSVGPGRWIACCPAHPDRSPSLSIRETEDGKILLFCFSGCHTSDVLAAVGLDFSDLFPEAVEHRKPIRRAFSASDALRCLAFEGALIFLAAKDILSGRGLSEADLERLSVAVGRINAALEVVS
jgi:hypothetical protein